jgi:UPF0716 protein FxsA
MMRFGWVAVALLLTPVIEIAVIIQVGQQIGVGWTVALLVLESALGAWLVKREGRRAWRALNEGFRTGAFPTGELADAALILVGGTLLLAPGFVTDVFGFFFVLPFTRPVARRLVQAYLARQAVTYVRGRTGLGNAPGPGRTAGGPPHGGPPGAGRDHRVVPGEVVDD